jgi:hypothetical protein
MSETTFGDIDEFASPSDSKYEIDYRKYEFWGLEYRKVREVIFM